MEEQKQSTSSNYFKGLSRRDYIQKAHEIIQQEGIQAVSIRRIAKEMGCSSASLYRYFDNVSELLYYAELRILTGYIDRLNEAEKSWESAIWNWINRKKQFIILKMGRSFLAQEKSC